MSRGQRVVTPIVLIAPTSKAPYCKPPDLLEVLNETDCHLDNGLEKDRVVALDVVPNRRHVKAPRQSRSMPAIAYGLSQKFSSTFSYPTVVHRPHLRTRPSFQSVREVPTAVHRVEDISNKALFETDLSSMKDSRSMSAGEVFSTGKTSLESNPLMRQSSFKEQDEHSTMTTPALTFVQQLITTRGVLIPIDELPVSFKPTLKTVETTANAKVFFETHFNSLLSGRDTPREIRRLDLEDKLSNTVFTPEQRHQERRVWAQLESEHLRQLRALRTQSSQATKASGVSVGGYKVVRVLGKGSFGVVRLVQEKVDGSRSKS